MSVMSVIPPPRATLEGPGNATRGAYLGELLLTGTGKNLITHAANIYTG